VTRLAYLFPGQGSQSPGMGRNLAEAFPESREVFCVADLELATPLSRVCFEGSADALAMTETTQPAVLTVSVAALRAIERAGLRPAAAAGHSLGEYTAYVAAGALDFRDAVRTVRLRGRLMQDAVPPGVGAMAAILGLGESEVEQLCREAAQGQVVAAANLNAPDQTVIAGHREAVDRAVRLACARGVRRAVPLPVSAPFHCSLMRPAAEALAPVLAQVAFSDPLIPVYSNVDARPVTSAEAAREALVRQVASPVRWQQILEALLDDGFEGFLEVGPGRVLAGLMRRLDRGARVIPVADAEGVANAVREFGRSPGRPPEALARGSTSRPGGRP
jgi:[acyl-carrier-protein] S-malonyltransferase